MQVSISNLHVKFQGKESNCLNVIHLPAPWLENGWGMEGTLIDRPTMIVFSREESVLQASWVAQQ